MIQDVIRLAREKKPLVHCIANHVTANDCANMLLACGASPIMAEDPEETAEIAAMCDALVLSLGTPSPRRIEAMLAAGRESNRLGRPVIFDPVGVGSSAFRMRAAERILTELKLTAIRGNSSELWTLQHGIKARRGVDADEAIPAADCERLARMTGAVVLCTGETDRVTDGHVTKTITGGHPMMRFVTGAGCQLSALMGAYAACSDAFSAAVAASWTMKRCAEKAWQRMTASDGNASFRNYLIDAVFHWHERNGEENDDVFQ